jgi:hypothetical protein
MACCAKRAENRRFARCARRAKPFEATFPPPVAATKAELETKPGKGFLIGAVAVLLAAYAAGLAGLAALLVIAKLVQ